MYKEASKILFYEIKLYIVYILLLNDVYNL